jgi:pre-rRNA-processing protein IPI3
MAISLTSTLLVVGTTSGHIHCYDIASHQLLRTITPNHTQPMSVTTVATILRPPDLVGHVSLNTNEREMVPVRPVLQLQRMRDTKARKAHEVMILPPPSQSSLVSVTS